MPISIAALIIVGQNSVRANAKDSLYLAQTPQLPPGTNVDDLPNSPLPDNQKDPGFNPLPPIEDFLDSPPNQLPDSGSSESNVEFTIKQFKLKGNTVLEEADVEAIVKDYRNRPITFADLLELETKITRLYTENGYINSGVVIPSQNVSKGIITINAIEGKVEEINVNVNGRLKEGYIRSRLSRGTKNPLNINELQEALQLLQLNPLVENLNAELSVGLSRDRWALDVDVNQGKAFDPVLFVNNYRTPSVGSFQRGIELNHNNLLGYADRASFIYKNTDGSNDFDASYSIPFNSLDGTVGLRYRYVDSEIIEEEFEELDIESQTSEFEITLRQPLLLRANSESTQEFALGLEFSRQSNSTELLGEPFPLSPGSGDESGDPDDIGETRISAIRFFQDWTKRTRKDVLAARSQLSAGVDIFDATVNEGAPDGKFVSWRGQVQWLRQLQSSSNINLLLRSDIQLSSDDLVPLERFSLGGVESVRGYRQDALLSDSGIFASAEVRIPFYRWNNAQSNLSAIPFIDVGTSWSNSENLNQDEDTVASFGVGLQLNLDDSLRARVDYGIPLVDVEDSDNTLQENGLYLSLEYFPF
ncbi:ShlB/FhaC/HecB family hemolysin secretion/activation protein [Waterburya agarophytonicola K14]|uniref:ShlB/FhaC/HecB family hemolysin secretion/activation protein n=2 Tax=Waterburya TaxID=2886915 RepID=A0A964BQS9_9CYAN|nr:ShlB/FhaC/HecB family hemolysin secretion/activation protein [Waterburya agarophytonicola KI4]